MSEGAKTSRTKTEMPMKPSKICVTPGCSVRVTAGHCAQHQQQLAGDRFNVGPTSYDQQRYRRARRRFLAAHPLCVDCKAQGVIEPATELDHILPHRGDVLLFWSTSNWAGRCTRHHREKTWRETLGGRGIDATVKSPAADSASLEKLQSQNRTSSIG
jgi:5-methylcytosine-specific restriction protein A